MSLGHTAPFFSLWHIVLYCIVSVHLYSASCSAHQPEALPRDVNKDLTPKDQDKDKDLTPKDQDKDKDLKYVLKESLRTRTRTTARQLILIAHINSSNIQW